jgi:hypothetical protein
MDVLDGTSFFSPIDASISVTHYLFKMRIKMEEGGAGQALLPYRPEGWATIHLIGDDQSADASISQIKADPPGRFVTFNSNSVPAPGTP